MTTTDAAAALTVQQLGLNDRTEIDELHQWVWSSTDDMTEEEYSGMEWDRTAGARVHGSLAGIYSAFSLQMSVPGGQVPVSGLTWVGVHPQHRRKGVLSAMMAHHFQEIAARGTEAISVLWAAEPAIYGRFGYGLAANALRLTIPRGALLRDVPGTEALTVRFENADVAKHTDLVDECYEEYRREHPGAVSRGLRGRAEQMVADPKAWRDGAERKKVLIVQDAQSRVRAVAVFRRKESWGATGPAGTVRVVHANALDAAAARVLWGCLADMDLMAKVSTDLRPVDDPLLHLLVDLRKAEVTLTDSLWLRVLDVPRALTSRAYSGPLDVVLDVRDDLVPANAGSWRLRTGPDGTAATCERAPQAQAQLRIDVRDLGSALLGGQSLRALAAAGLVEPLEATALDQAAQAFGWPVAAFNGSNF